MNKLPDAQSEWTLNAEARHNQIISGVDISYHQILIPTIMQLVGNINGKRVIDVGCGSGYLAAEIAKSASFTLGVDPSSGMIKVANREYNNIPRLGFINESIENFAKNNKEKKFDIAISNMSLITIKNLDLAIKSVNSVLVSNGVFVINITHPCFYNRYRKYQKDDEFQYILPHSQKGNFLISKDKKGLPSSTTHFHRPLQKYFKSLRDASFMIDQLVEPYPNSKIMKLYPKPWDVPHFLSLRCVKI